MYKLKSNRTGVLIHANDVESSAIDQIKLIANHPSIRGLVSIMPDVHAGAGCVIGFTGKFGQSVIPNIVGVDIGCFIGDTEIPLCNGSLRTLESLVGEKPFFICSLNENLKPVPGEAIAVKTRSDAELMEVILNKDHPHPFVCTPDQKIMMLDGTYKHAEDLEKGDVLMSIHHYTPPGKHKEVEVIDTKKCSYKSDVYCLKVTKYHNFALKSGVFVHNCGVTTHELHTTNNLPLNLPGIYDFIEQNIPSGFNSRKERVALTKNEKTFINYCEKLVKSLKLKANPSLQAGTLGGGNHFIEIEKSETTGKQYLTVHSGSRKFGLEIAKYYQKKAKELMKAMNISVPNDLEYLPLGEGQLGKDYIHDMGVAQRYAELNRNLMLRAILKFMRVQYDEELVTTSTHNYISKRDNIIRKGAISAHCHENIVIPLNMGKHGGIVLGEGLGNKDYNYSAPHGAGRISSRSAIKKQLKIGDISMDQFEEQMKGIYTRSAVESTIDESPMAYRAYSDIEQYLTETVKVIDIARPIMSFKDTTK